MKNKIILFFATGAGLGKLKTASGTFGTLWGIPLVLGMRGISLTWTCLFVLFFILFSVWVSTKAEEILNQKDSSLIVIDEVAGFLVTMFVLPVNWVSVVFGFALFRLFDISKPWPVRWLEKNLKKGWGVVLDDVMAGVLAHLCLRVILYFW